MERRPERQANTTCLPFGSGMAEGSNTESGTITASVAAQDQGYPYKSHLAGGIIAWKAAGLPTKT